jgi:ferritin-like metal-binding protein YciE
MAARSFEELFLDELKDVYDAEQRIVKALPKMIRAASASALKTALDEHLKQTEWQVKRIEQAFEHLGKSAKGKTCEAMKGLLAEGDELTHESDDRMVNDAAIIAAAQKVEHYEIATYGTLREWARQLGHSPIATLMQETLDEESGADKRLTTIAQTLTMGTTAPSR